MSSDQGARQRRQHDERKAHTADKDAKPVLGGGGAVFNMCQREVHLRLHVHRGGFSLRGGDADIGMFTDPEFAYRGGR